MNKIGTTWRIFSIYILILFLMLFAQNSFAQMKAICFNADWNKANNIEWFDKLTDVEQNAILDYANGMSWKQIRAKYGKSINQSNLQLFKKKEYTKSEVLRILKEYKMDGKGSVKLDWINDPEYFPDE